MSLQTVKNLKKNGIIKIGVNVKNEDILIGKIKKTEKANFKTQLLRKLIPKVNKIVIAPEEFVY